MSHLHSIFIARRLGILAAFSALAAGCSTLYPTDRPTGRNCSLGAPPAEAGEETGHGVFLQVFPRISSMGPRYTGCQAVFLTTKDHPATLAWLVDVVDGDPVRLWSTDKSMSSILACRFRRGVLAGGDPKQCREASVRLLPSMPAGCALVNSERATCEYDGK